jgi:6-phosphogluconolactonase
VAVRTYADLDALIAAAAEDIATLVREVTATRPFRISLAGGSTPIPLYARLATMSLPWDRIELWFGDERMVPPDHPDSNYRMACRSLLERIGATSTAHRIQGELPADQAAAIYERELVAALGEPPRFDLVLLGLGTDGHTASLFPHTPALHEAERWVVPTPHPSGIDLRVTLTARAITAAHHVRFLVSGPSKAGVLREVLEGPRDPDRLPSQLIAEAATDVVWFVDDAAAAQLTRTS